METIKTIVLTKEQEKELASLAKEYKKELAQEKLHKKNKDTVGDKIKNILGNNFDGEITIDQEEYTGTIRYKYIISFVANKEEIIKRGLYDELYEPTQAHKLTV